MTLYNKKTLTPVKSQGCLTTPTSPTTFKYRGLECEFTHNQSRLPVVITNLHLSYEHNYVRAIIEYQQQKIKENKFMIMGGDTNNTQNKDSENMIGNWQLATTFHSLKDNPECYTLHDGNNPDLKKHYDGFFVSPTQDTFAYIVDTAGKHFELSEDKKSVIVKTSNPSTGPDAQHAKHVSEVGLPWKRTIYYLKDLENELSQKRSEAEHKAILLKMNEICLRRTEKNLLNYIEGCKKADAEAFALTLTVIEREQITEDFFNPKIAGPAAAAAPTAADIEPVAAPPASNNNNTRNSADKFITHMGPINNPTQFIEICKTIKSKLR